MKTAIFPKVVLNILYLFTFIIKVSLISSIMIKIIDEYLLTLIKDDQTIDEHTLQDNLTEIVETLHQFEGILNIQF